jgi:hypothetical protein
MVMLASLWRMLISSNTIPLGHLSDWQLRERHYEMMEADRRGEADSSSCVVSHARLVTAADRGRARDAQRAKLLSFNREKETR